MSIERFEMFTDQEVSKALKIGRSTLARWREQGLINYIKTPNGQVRYLARHIEELIKRYEKEKGSTAGTVRGRQLSAEQGDATLLSEALQTLG